MWVQIVSDFIMVHISPNARKKQSKKRLCLFKRQVRLNTTAVQHHYLHEHVSHRALMKSPVSKRKNASINPPPNSPLIVSSTPLQSEKSEQQQQRYRTQPNPSRTSPFISRNPTPVLTKQNNYQHMHLLSKQRHNFLIYKTPNTIRSEHYQSTSKTTASSTIQRLQTEIRNKNSAPWKRRGTAYTSLCP